MGKSVCVDLDGTLAKYDGFKGVDIIGDPIEGAVDFVNKLYEKYNVIIFTARLNPKVNRKAGEIDRAYAAIVAWLNQHNFKYHSIYISNGKPMADAYIDDRAVECRPQEHENAYQDALTRVEQLTNGKKQTKNN